MNRTNNNTKTATKAKAKSITVDSFSVDRVHEFDNGGVVADLTINGIKIYGVRVVEGKEKDFLSFPQRKGVDGKHYSIVYAFISDEDQADIIKEVENALSK